MPGVYRQFLRVDSVTGMQINATALSRDRKIRHVASEATEMQRYGILVSELIKSRYQCSEFPELADVEAIEELEFLSLSLYNPHTRRMMRLVIY